MISGGAANANAVQIGGQSSSGMIITDGGGHQVFTTTALENAPSGGGGGGMVTGFASGLVNGNGFLKVDVQDWLGSTAVAFPSAASIAAAIQSLGDISFTLVSPVMQNGALTIVRGDDYFNADGRAITWTASGGVWPNLAGATIALVGSLSASAYSSGTKNYDVAGVVSESGSGTQAVYVELPESVTGSLAVGASAYDFALVATLADGHVATLAQGSLTVKAQS